jgi:hypothetical protein
VTVDNRCVCGAGVAGGVARGDGDAAVGGVEHDYYNAATGVVGGAAGASVQSIVDSTSSTSASSAQPPAHPALN